MVKFFGRSVRTMTSFACCVIAAVMFSGLSAGADSTGNSGSPDFTVAGISFGMTKDEAREVLLKSKPDYDFHDLGIVKDRHLYQNSDGFRAVYPPHDSPSMPEDLLTVMTTKITGVWAVDMAVNFMPHQRPETDVFFRSLSQKLNLPDSYFSDFAKPPREFSGIYGICYDSTLAVVEVEKCSAVLKPEFILQTPDLYHTMQTSLGTRIPGSAAPGLGAYVDLILDTAMQGDKQVVRAYKIMVVSIKDRYRYLQETDGFLTEEGGKPE